MTKEKTKFNEVPFKFALFTGKGDEQVIANSKEEKAELIKAGNTVAHPDTKKAPAK